ncbi:unnamed protein product [Didymodactylos carnosus]|uniref:ChrR-like cupin domain-containing protein n=1 Tax=Didymodactylos carnosus TaxID=1234261 RepID=A0A814FQA5_9BILA|nr:unnamed protein product [Didymodactylos carnosus]CAF3758336.1 unnamed protein product [Didymodactylos carnosus]
MQLRSDLNVPYVINSNKIEYIDSPTNGVQRRMLDRIGDEVARATTIVKFAPNKSFPHHKHGGGEEFLILDGVFSDEISGDHSKYTYCRHGIDTEHHPWTKDGCVLLVKLRQMNDRDEKDITFIDGQNATSWRVDEEIQGRSRLDLFSSEKTGETVWMEKWEPKTQFKWTVGEGGEELFILEGDMNFSSQEQKENSNNNTIHSDENTPNLDVNNNCCIANYWIRRPISWKGREFNVWTENGCRIFVKTGHLAMKLDIH